MSTPLNQSRIASIDLLRGVVMIIMALDHVRDYFHADAFLFDPSDISQTTPWLFFTRFITHYCAPVFIFLAGTSAFFVGKRLKKNELSIWLIKRGFWLIFVELVIMKLGWNFNLDYTFTVFQVIWALGASMLFLAAFIHIPKYAMIAISVIVILGHNIFDGFQPSQLQSLWTLTHVMATIATPFTTIFSAYPLIPWIFVMPLGYHFGQFYTNSSPPENRRRIIRKIGFVCIFAFFLLRALNFYGDPNLWTQQASFGHTTLSFFHLTKYPPSLLYLLITLGPALLLLSYAEKWTGKVHQAVVTIGRVPMFYYIVHIYLIHAFALIAAVATGFPAESMIIELFVTLSPELKGYGFDLWFVYMVWIVVITLLYPLCVWYNRYKISNRDKWWLSYL